MYLLGASGHAKVIVDILKLNNHTVTGFYDDDPDKKSLLEIPVLGDTKAFQHSSEKCIISIGNNTIRKKVSERIRTEYFLAIHPKAIISSMVQIGDGSVVMGGAVINTDTVIGKHAIINTSSSIDHDCTIADFVHIAPNVTLCGSVKVGEGTLVGSGAVVMPNITIGKWAVIGAGSVITADVPDYAVIVGNPGKVIKYNKPT